MGSTDFRVGDIVEHVATLVITRIDEDGLYVGHEIDNDLDTYYEVRPEMLTLLEREPKVGDQINADQVKLPAGAVFTNSHGHHFFLQEDGSTVNTVGKRLTRDHVSYNLPHTIVYLPDAERRSGAVLLQLPPEALV